jgi:hypothetical protein
MSFYIKSDSLGLFVGHFLGFGFFTCHIADGTLDPKERPIKFTSRKEAENYLASWVGKSDCYVVEMTDEQVDKFMKERVLNVSG